MNWKDKLELKYTKEEAYYGAHMAAVLHCYWRGFLLMRKMVEVKKADFDFDHCKLLLRTWFDRSVLNYDDLTTRQKRRIENFPFVGEEWSDEFKRLHSYGCYLDPEYLKYAKIKVIRVRVSYGYSWSIAKKMVICELLQES